MDEDETKELQSLCSNLARLTQPPTHLFEGVVPLLEVCGVRGEPVVFGESPREGVPLALRLRQRHLVMSLIINDRLRELVPDRLRGHPHLQLVHPVTLLIQGGLQREVRTFGLGYYCERLRGTSARVWAEPGSRNIFAMRLECWSPGSISIDI